MTTLVTGAAGFIGFHVASSLLEAGEEVLGVDVLRADRYADLRAARLGRLMVRPGFSFERVDVARPDALWQATTGCPVDRVVHLAARANARESVTSPSAYVHDNLMAFAEVLEHCRQRPVSHLVFASSGSVYGAGTGRPASPDDRTDRPRSFYAATKKANEVMAYSYADAYRLPCTALRFFNVYGPWARPDSAAVIFARAIVSGEPVPLFGAGAMTRSFTYVDDAVRAVIAALEHPPVQRPDAPFRAINVAAARAATVDQLLSELEQLLGRRSERHVLPMQPGEVRNSVGEDADGNATLLREGLERFLEWFNEYHADDGDNPARRYRSEEERVLAHPFLPGRRDSLHRVGHPAGPGRSRAGAAGAGRADAG